MITIPKTDNKISIWINYGSMNRRSRQTSQLTSVQTIVSYQFNQQLNLYESHIYHKVA